MHTSKQECRLENGGLPYIVEASKEIDALKSFDFKFFDASKVLNFYRGMKPLDRITSRAAN